MPLSTFSKKMIARRLSSSEPQGQVHKCNRSEWRINVGSHKVDWKYYFVQLFNADQWSFRHRRCSSILFRQFGWKRGEMSNIGMNCNPFVTHSKTERVFGMFLSVEMGDLSVRLLTLETSTGEYWPPVDFCSIWARRWIKCSLRMKHRHVQRLRYSCGLILESPIPRRYCHNQLQAVPLPQPHSSLSWCVERKLVNNSSSVQHLSLLYCLLSKLELAVLQLSS